jgi:hypothetical protein
VLLYLFVCPADRAGWGGPRRVAVLTGMQSTLKTLFDPQPKLDKIVPSSSFVEDFWSKRNYLSRQSPLIFFYFTFAIQFALVTPLL